MKLYICLFVFEELSSFIARRYHKNLQNFQICFPDYSRMNVALEHFMLRLNLIDFFEVLNVFEC